jgi:bifunctional UDP-N-acetylglucosamine pyrophosphorylase/glucosamine-1-phosphate N-acetyltransferase
MTLKVVILAAGKGTRMRSSLPKVLQPLANRPLLAHVLGTAQALAADEVLTIIGHGAQAVKSAFADSNSIWVEQARQLGTGHAVQQVLPYIDAEDTVLILYGDVPLTSARSLEDLVSLVTREHPLALLTVVLDNPSGYGRIVRDPHHAVCAIVEQKDAQPDQLLINEVNTGIMAVKGGYLQAWLSRLTNQNAQGEYYLTDIIAMAVSDGFAVQTTSPQTPLEVLGVNDKVQLQYLEREYQRGLADQLMQQGVTLLDANRVDIRGEVQVGQDVELDVNVILQGRVVLGNRVKIGANVVLNNVEIAEGTVIQPFCHIEQAKIGADCRIGPYARIRPGTDLANQVHVGNFVEVKNARVGVGSKMNHLSYIGDTQMGEGVNIGAGTITCNYDGVNKHQTIIGDRVFVGSDSQLVAPVTIENDATIGAGSTITKTAPAGELTLSRSKQMTIKGWQKPAKKPRE